MPGSEQAAAAIPAQLCGISFVRKSSWSCISEEKCELFKWIMPYFALSAACLSHIYLVTFITVNPSTKVDLFLNETIFDTFYEDLQHLEDSHDPFCGLIWVKLLFFLGFAISQFSMGFLADHFGHLNMMKNVVKGLVIFGILSTISMNVYVFGLFWILLAICATSSYLLLVCPILNETDKTMNNWKARLVFGIFFQMSWTFGRVYSNFVVFLANSWIQVIIILILILLLIQFIYEDNLWGNIETEKKTSGLVEFWHDLQTSGILYINILILSITWFTLGYNYYGAMLSWNIISDHKKHFEHNILASVLAVMSKICALIICYVSQRKCMPLIVLQIFSAICYFVLSSVIIDSPDSGFGATFVLHISTFFITSSFALVWVMTPETFPKAYRATCTGICSGSARIGAIAGIIVGELKLLHSSLALNVIVGSVTILGAILLKVLPDMTNEDRMPETLEDVARKQFPERSKKEDSSNAPPV